VKEIVIIMGYQAAGKSSVVGQYERQGYTRVNRDNLGGNLAKLNEHVERLMTTGVDRFVLDNTYGTKDSRQAVLDMARRHGFTVKCVWLTTSLEDAQYNASYRLLKKFVLTNPPLFKMPEILGPNCAKVGKDQCCVPSIAQYAYRKSFQEPSVSEGFSAVERVAFSRNLLPIGHHNKAVILDYDGTLRVCKSGRKYPKDPFDVEVLPGRKEVLQRYENDGYILLGASNQSGIEKGDLTEKEAIACFEQTNKLLGFDIDYQYCPHHSFPIRCYCRKPLPGMGVYLIEKHMLDPSECIMVGDSTSDKTFAKRCGFRFTSPENFFA
jgi:HAD superfamily hydrolase (TIGR01662 family)